MRASMLIMAILLLGSLVALVACTPEAVIPSLPWATTNVTFNISIDSLNGTVQEAVLPEMPGMDSCGGM